MTTAILTRPTTEAKPLQQVQLLPLVAPHTLGAIQLFVDLEELNPERDEDGVPFGGSKTLKLWVKNDGHPLGNRIRKYVAQQHPGWQLQPGPQHPGWYTGPVCDEF